MQTGPILCDKCGYDLTGNTSGKCPECGAPASKVGRMPPQWRILVIVLGVPAALLTVALVWLTLKSVLSGFSSG